MPPKFSTWNPKSSMPRKKIKKTSTQGLTGQWGLVDIPGLTEEDQTEWKIQCLSFKKWNGETVSPALDDLGRWLREETTEFGKLFRSIKYAGTHKIHTIPDRIRRDKRKRGGYEIKSTHCKCRLMFFYQREQRTLICTNTYWKERNSKKRDQDQAFKICADLKEKYLTSKNQEQ